MGYYSDIKLITTREGWAKLDEAVRKVVDSEYLAENNYLTDSTRIVPLNGGEFVLAEWEGIQWEEYRFPEVRVFMDTLLHLDDDIPYEFMRVGEDYNDVVYYHNSSNYDMPTLRIDVKIEVEY